MVFPILVWALSPTITGKQAINSILPWDHENSPTFELTMSYHFLYGYFLSVTFVNYFNFKNERNSRLLISFTTWFSQIRFNFSGGVLMIRF